MSSPGFSATPETVVRAPTAYPTYISHRDLSTDTLDIHNFTAMSRSRKIPAQSALTLLGHWYRSRQHLRDAIESFSRDSVHILSAIGSLPRDSEQVTDFWSSFDEEMASIIETDGNLLNNSITGIIKKRNQVASPIGKLPEHILAMIFEMAVDTTWSRDRFYKTPLALSSVCARWRDVALETRMIWRYVTLDIGIWRDTSTNYGPGTFLKKAGGVPIFLTVRSDKRPELLDMQYRIVELIDEIAPFSGSVVSLDISFMHPEYMSTFVQSWLDQCTSVSLRNLSLANQREPINMGLWTAKSTAGAIEINPTAFVELLSQIRSLSISNAAIPRSRNAFRNLLELRTANTLVRHRPSIRKVARVLAGCSNIHTLELRHFAPTPFRDEQVEPLVLPKLKSLSIGDTNSDGLAGLLSLIHWPLPNRLKLDYQEDSHPLYNEQADWSWSDCDGSRIRFQSKTFVSSLPLVLSRMPEIYSMMLINIPLDEPALEGLNSPKLCGNGALSSIHTIVLVECRVGSTEKFKETIISRKVQRLVLVKCAFPKEPPIPNSHWALPSSDLSVCKWLAQAIPCFDIINSGSTDSIPQQIGFC